MVYGKTIRLPGEFFDIQKSTANQNSFTSNLIQQMDQLKPTNSKFKSHSSVYVHPNLKQCTHVFVRVDRVKKGLEPPYEGPFPVQTRTEKYFGIIIKDKEQNISIDRLKPAYLLSDCTTPSHEVTPGPSTETTIQQNTTTPTKSDVQKKTRRGRIVRFPARYLSTITR